MAIKTLYREQSHIMKQVSPVNQSRRIKQAWQITRKNFDPSISVYLPGFFILDGKKGKYPAISITGSQCKLQCEHCQSKILEPMIAATDPEMLLEKCLKLSKEGNYGVLISGGCDENGCLPWDDFIPVIKEIKQQTRLFISVHCGMVDETTALELKNAGVDQALIDIIGDDQTLRDIYHVDFGIHRIQSTLAALNSAGLPIVPHIVCGLHFGEIRGEKNAVAMISEFDVEQVVILSVMNLPGTAFESNQFETNNPLKTNNQPDAWAVADIIAQARLAMPETLISLGCARQRGGRLLEFLAIETGVNRMALPSDEAIAYARNLGLEIHHHDTCCSVP